MPWGSVSEESWEGDAGLTIELGLAHTNNDDGHGEFGSLGEDRGGVKTYVRDRYGQESRASGGGMKGRGPQGSPRDRTGNRSKEDNLLGAGGLGLPASVKPPPPSGAEAPP